MNMTGNRYPKACYDMLKRLDIIRRKNWATSVRLLLCKYGFEEVWNQQGVTNEREFLKIFRERLINSDTQEWILQVQNQSRLSTFCIFKLES